MPASRPDASTHDSTHHRPATIAVTAGRPRIEPDAPFNPPIAMASTFVAGGDLEYGRYGNPTWTAFEEALGALEGGRALAYASGMAAVTAVLDLVGIGSGVVGPQHAYTGSVMALGDLESRGRLHAKLLDITDTDAVIEQMTDDEDCAILWLESPTNPALEIADLPRLIEAAHRLSVRVVVDNTFATPLRQNPLELGADIVLHSATKFIAGHSDVQMGALVVRDDDVLKALKDRRDLTGNTPGPFETWLALRGMRTLHVRLDRAEENAKDLADRLELHPAVEEVRYPGFGAVVSAVVAGGGPAADRMCRETRLWVHATSLGGVESTLERRRRWKAEAPTIPEGLVRFSVGIEDPLDLWADLQQALDTIAPQG